MKYFVRVGTREVVVDIDGERVAVDGEPCVASLLLVPGTPIRVLTVDGRTAALPIESLGRGHWTIARHGERIELEVVDERTRHIRQLTGGGAAAAGPTLLRAPMPGLVVQIAVEAGAVVSAGQGVVVLEAMKMENELTAAAAGRVRAVLVVPGQAVEKGQPLIEFERPAGGDT